MADTFLLAKEEPKNALDQSQWLLLRVKSHTHLLSEETLIEIVLISEHRVLLPYTFCPKVKSLEDSLKTFLKNNSVDEGHVRELSPSNFSANKILAGSANDPGIVLG